MSSINMAEAASHELKLTVKCPLCLDDCENPKSLPCLHSFCLHCLQQFWKDSCPGDEVSCPVCGKVLEIPDRGLDKLPHISLKNLRDCKEMPNKQPGEPLCESCEVYADETEATMYCVDCNQKLCERCGRVHETMPGEPHQVKELGSEGLTTQLRRQRDSCCRRRGSEHTCKLALYCFDCKISITVMESFTAHAQMSKSSACVTTRAASELHAQADELLNTCVTHAHHCAPDVKFVSMNIHELTGSDDGDENLIGQVLTSHHNSGK